MQIVSELEGYRRGPSGAVGHVLPGRRATMDTCIAIRTIVLTDGVARLQAGAGIVADSDPAAEAPRVPPKLAALEAAIDLAEEAVQMLLMLDNYDSFTYNLVHLFEELGAEVSVFETTRSRRRGGGARAEPSRRLSRPGPAEDAGVSVELIRRLGPRVPTLGVCLGHQAIVEAFGGEVGQAKALLHGKSSPVEHDGRGVFRPARPVRGGPLPLARGAERPGQARGDRANADGEVMGVATASCRSRASSSIPSRC